MGNQTSWIAASLFIGFVVFITIRGELPAYKAAILNGQGSDNPVTAAASAIGTSSTAGSDAATNVLLGQGGG